MFIITWGVKSLQGFVVSVYFCTTITMTTSIWCLHQLKGDSGRGGASDLCASVVCPLIFLGGLGDRRVPNLEFYQCFKQIVYLCRQAKCMIQAHRLS